MFCCGRSAEPVRKKVVLVGDTFAGKTCMQEVFRTGAFSHDHSPTVFLNYYCEMNVGDVAVELSVWDTAGLTEFERMRPFSYAEADVVVICVPVDSSEARVNLVEKWMPEVDFYCSNVPVVLVGTKIDLRETTSDAMTTLQGKDLASAIAAAAYVECSAKTGHGVDDVFHTAVNVASRNSRRMNGKRKKKTRLRSDSRAPILTASLINHTAKAV